jgi:hypothetical protein
MGAARVVEPIRLGRAVTAYISPSELNANGTREQQRKSPNSIFRHIFRAW